MHLWTCLRAAKGREQQEPETGHEIQSFIEQAHVKAERNLLRLLAEGDLVLRERLTESDMVLPSHKRIWSLLEGYDGPREAIWNHVESGCTDVESSKEWAIIKSQIEVPSDIDKDILAEDYLKTIRHYEIESKKRAMQKKIKELEEKGLLKESLELAKELIELQKASGR